MMRPPKKKNTIVTSTLIAIIAKEQKINFSSNIITHKKTVRVQGHQQWRWCRKDFHSFHRRKAQIASFLLYFFVTVIYKMLASRIVRRVSQNRNFSTMFESKNTIKDVRAKYYANPEAGTFARIFPITS